jgi:hypothetical protein
LRAGAIRAGPQSQNQDGPIRAMGGDFGHWKIKIYFKIPEIS